MRAEVACRMERKMQLKIFENSKKTKARNKEQNKKGKHRERHLSKDILNKQESKSNTSVVTMPLAKLHP